VSLEAPNAPTGLTIATLHPGDGSVIWRHTLTDTDLPAPILYSQGTLFIVSAQVTATDMNYSLTAFDVTSGSQLWQKALGMGTLTGYVVGDAAVYVSMFAGHVPAEGSPHAVVASAAALDIAVSNPALRSPNDGTLTAYRASDGMQPWQASGFMTAQAEIGGMLYATVGQQQSSGLAAFAVRAYRATSGEQLWQSDTLGSGDIYQDKPAVCVDTRAAYVFNKPETQPGVHALNGASGRPVWSVPLADHVVSSVAGLDRVYAGAVTTPPAVVQTQVTVIALDAASGATEWKGLARQDPERPACAAVVPPSEPASHPPAWCGSAVSSPFSW
jgi:outer membrane protein assembly factor BamB